MCVRVHACVCACIFVCERGKVLRQAHTDGVDGVDCRLRRGVREHAAERKHPVEVRRDQEQAEEDGRPRHQRAARQAEADTVFRRFAGASSSVAGAAAAAAAAARGRLVAVGRHIGLAPQLPSNRTQQIVEIANESASRQISTKAGRRGGSSPLRNQTTLPLSVSKATNTDAAFTACKMTTIMGLFSHDAHC
jgi:hypothetical protein